MTPSGATNTNLDFSFEKKNCFHVFSIKPSLKEGNDYIEPKLNYVNEKVVGDIKRYNSGGITRQSRRDDWIFASS